MKQTFVMTSDRSLMVVDETPCKTLSRMQPGEMIVLDVKVQRNPKYHKLCMSWLAAVFQNQDHWQTFNQMRYELTCRAGYIDCQYVGDDGKVIIKPKSLAFEAMEEDEFHQWHKAVDTVLQEQFGINIEMGFH